MKLKLLRIFTAVYEEKSITGAARRLGLTQPQVSVAVRELEARWNVRLTEPDGRGIRITEAGRQLYRGAQPIVSLCAALDAGMRSIRDGGMLRIGSSISIGTCMLPQLVQRFEQAEPDVTVHVTINSAELIEQAVLDGRLDFALIEGAAHSARLEVEPYLDDELALICGPRHPLASASPISVEQLSGARLLLRERNSATRAMAEAFLNGCGVPVLPSWESTDTTALINAAAMGLGVAILPLRFVQPHIDRGEVVRLELPGAQLRRTYNIIYLKSRYLSHAAARFLHLVDEHERTRFG